MPNSHHIGDRLVNHMVTDSRNRFGDTAAMTIRGKFPNHLQAHLEQRDVSVAELARRANEQRQVIHKIAVWKQKLTKEWAVRLAPLLGLTWQQLLDAPQPGFAEAAAPYSSARPPSEIDRLPEVADALTTLLAERQITLGPRRLMDYALKIFDRITDRDRRLSFEDRLEMTMSEVANEVAALFGRR